MATTDLQVTSVTSASSGWGGTATVANLEASDDQRAAGGLKNDDFVVQIQDAPGDFSSLNTVQLFVEGRRPVSGGRSIDVTVELQNSIGTVLESFTTGAFTTTDQVFSSSAFTRTDDAATIDGYQIRVLVNEGGGMAQGDEAAEIDHVFLRLDYTAATSDTNVAANTDALTLTEQAATVNAETNVQANVSALTLTEQAATVNAETNVQAATDALTLTTFSATVNAETNVQAGTDALSVSTFAASIGLGGDTNVAANTHALTLTEQAATVNAATNILAQTDALTVSTLSASIRFDRNVQAGVAALTLTERSASIQSGGGGAIPHPVRIHRTQVGIGLGV